MVIITGTFTDDLICSQVRQPVTMMMLAAAEGHSEKVNHVQDEPDPISLFRGLSPTWPMMMKKSLLLQLLLSRILCFDTSDLKLFLIFGF